MFTIPCVIFAGGKSSRMGEDKSLLPFGEESSLTQFQYKRLQHFFSHVYISCKDASKFDFDADFIIDPILSSTYAPTAGFVALFEHLPDDRVFVISVDTPFVDEKEIQQLFDADDDNLDAVVARSPEGMHPMCGIYHRSLEEKFIKMYRDDTHKLGMLLKQSKTKEVNFDSDLAFSNLNLPHEYQAALKRS